MKIIIALLLLISICSMAFTQDQNQTVTIYPQTTVHAKDKSAFFSPDGNYFVTGSFIDQVHLWDFNNGSLVRTFGFEVPRYPKSYKYFDESVFPVFSPDGTKVAVLFRSYPDSFQKKQTEKLVFYYTESGESIYDDMGMGWGGKDHITCMTFSNTNRLFAYCAEDKDYNVITILSMNRRGSDRVFKSFLYSSARPAILSMAFSTNDRVLALGTEKGITLIDVNYNRPGGAQSPMNNDWVLEEISSAPVYSIKYSKDGSRIIAADGGDIKVWDSRTNRLVRTLQGRRNASVKCLALSSDNSYIIASFSDKSIMKWDITNEKALFVLENIPAACSSVDIHPSNKFILLGREDGVISSLDFETGYEIIAYMSFNTEWLSITPDGYYNSSPNGDEQLNLRIGNDVYALNQFSKAFNHPEVLTARLRGETDPAVVRHFGDIMLSVAPPAVMVELTNSNSVSSSGVAQLNIKVVDAINRYPLEYVEIIVNGRLVGGNELTALIGEQLIPLATKIQTIKSNANMLEFNLPVELENGYNHIEVVAANEACYGVYSFETTNISRAQVKPDLWILGIGINNYVNLPEINTKGMSDLKSAAGDARRIISAFKEQEGRRFNKVNALLVADNEGVNPNRSNIIESMKFFKQVKPNDVAVFFVAAHGLTIDDVFYFLPSDTSFTDVSGNYPVLASIISIDSIIAAMNIPGRKIIFIDTCESGGVDNNLLIRTLKNRSTVIFTASQQNELAQESESYGGHFTYSIVEGLSKENNPKGRLVDLGLFVTNTVEELSRFGGRGKVRQRPNIIIPEGFINFIVAE